jgi:hypothetical protein
MEWVTIVCSLSEKPLRNFTTDFCDNAPFECIMNFYFPRERTTLPQQYQEYLGGMLGEMSLYIPLTNSGKTNGVRSETHFPDSRVITLMLGVLASRVLIQNDRIDVIRVDFRAYNRLRRKFKGYSGNLRTQISERKMQRLQYNEPTDATEIEKLKYSLTRQLQFRHWLVDICFAVIGDGEHYGMPWWGMDPVTGLVK